MQQTNRQQSEMALSIQALLALGSAPMNERQASSVSTDPMGASLPFPMYQVVPPRSVTTERKDSRLRASLSCPSDQQVLSKHQIFLRMQIEAFTAISEDISTHTRGRNKTIMLGQVGICCRHCAHLPAKQRAKGSAYYPASTLGFYQAAQNMCTTHMQSGVCPEMPLEIKDTFSQLLGTKTMGSGAGRAYWSAQGRRMGLVDTERGIFPSHAVPYGVKILQQDQPLYKPNSSPSKSQN